MSGVVTSSYHREVDRRRAAGDVGITRAIDSNVPSRVVSASSNKGRVKHDRIDDQRPISVVGSELETHASVIPQQVLSSDLARAGDSHLIDEWFLLLDCTSGGV